MIDKQTPVMMLDTETTNDIMCPFVYDVGYQVFTLADGVICEHSFVNADVFLEKELMASAFFADKIPIYWEEIKAGKRDLRKWLTIKRQIAKDCSTYGVKIICAHNASFDNRALNTTQRYLTTSKYRYFLPYGVEWWDTLNSARKILKHNESYGAFCYDHDLLTQRGQRRYTAEAIYKWLTDNPDFEEKHTGLEDVEIERHILEFLLEQDPNLDGRLWKD